MSPATRIFRAPRPRPAFALAVLALLALATAARPAAADVRVMETVGAVPIVDGVRATRAPRDAAILQAQYEAVAQVASELLMDAGPMPSPDDPTSGGGDGAEPDLEQVLGRDMGRYTSRFRILEDRGEGPARYSTNPRARAEYVVLVEVQVDVERVRGRLIEAGLVAPSGLVPEGRSFILEVRGLGVYPAYAALREAIVGGAGARSVVPVSMARDWVVLRVESEDSGTDFLEKLLDSTPPELDLVPLEAERERLRLSVRWTPPPADPETGRGDS